MVLAIVVPVTVLNPAVAYADVPLQNPGFETVNGQGTATCWQPGGSGTNTVAITTTTPGHTGTNAGKIDMTAYTSGDWALLTTQNAACSPAVTAGKTYSISLWYKSTTAKAGLTLYRHDTTTNAWSWVQNLGDFPQSAAYAQYTAQTPVIPANTDMISFGGFVYGLGALSVDDFALAEVVVAPPAGTLPNPGFENVDAGGNATCWQAGGSGTNTVAITTSTPGHTGNNAGKINMTAYTSGDWALLTTHSAACSPAATAGKTYTISLWYQSTTPKAGLTLYRHDSTTGAWSWVQNLGDFPQSATWAQFTAQTPVIPANTDQISFGGFVYGLGSLQVDDFAVAETVAAAPAAPPNPGFENVNGAGAATCWQAGGSGNNTVAITTTTPGHTGNNAGKIDMTAYTSGDWALLTQQNTACSPAATPGKTYSISLWYKSTTPKAGLTLYRHDSTTGAWSWVQNLGDLPQSATFAQFTATTPVIPANTDQISFGGFVYGLGALTVDDFAVAETTVAPSGAVQNPGFEAVDGGGNATCWMPGGSGTNTVAITTGAPGHTGNNAGKINMTAYTSGDWAMMTQQTPACSPTAIAGHQYKIGMWYQSTTAKAGLTLYRHDSTTGAWSWLQNLGDLPLSATWAQFTAMTPVLPPNTDQISFGGFVYGQGSLQQDDFTLLDTTAGGTAACTGTAVQCAKGEWTVLPTQLSVRAIHEVLLNNGKILMVAGSGNNPDNFAAGSFKSAVFDPATNTFTDVPTPVDMFCVGHVQLPDGRVLVMGGTAAYDNQAAGHGFLGLKNSYVFDPATNQYTRINDMIDGHWYPSATSLGNGDVVSVGGLGPTGNNVESPITEYYSVAQGRWLTQAETVQTNRRWGLYPTLILMQDGRLFYTGSHTLGGNAFDATGAEIYDYNAGTRTDVAGLQNKDLMDHSMSLLLPPAQNQTVMTFGGGNTVTNVDAGRLTNIIDLKAANPTYQAGPLLPTGTMTDTGAAETAAQGKMYESAVILPDGKIFETGGSLHTRADNVSEASIYDPVTNTFTPGMATDPVGRNYHSSAILLPDGRVMAVGSDPANGNFELRISIYSPTYLFHGPRPAITATPAGNWGYGTTQQITVDKPIVKAQLIRPAAVTHSSDPNQRSVDLPLTGNGLTLGLNMVNNPNLAPTGWYMLTVTDANGIPSLAKWVHVA